jgi:PQQ-dependent dehydrogenase (methanol/ethanol family)
VKIGFVVACLVACVVAVSACGGSGGTTTTSSTSSAETAKEGATTKASFSAAALEKSASPESSELTEGAGANWATVGGDLGDTRFSTLKQIDTGNAANLHLVWQEAYSQPLDEKTTGVLEEESAPLVNEGVMYVVTPEENVLAVDATDGEKIWEYKSQIKKQEEVVEFGAGVQGLSLGEGRVYVEDNAGRIDAISASTGELDWQKTIIEPGTKIESPATPVYYEGVVYAGISGAETARGHVNAYEAKTGKELWTTNLVCGPTETPTENGKCPKKLSDNEGGGTVWTWPAFDVKDGLLFVGTANPSNDEGTAGDYKWATSLVALEMKTGEIKWGFQCVHHDMWDYDCTTPPVFFEKEVGGQMKGIVAITSKTDMHYELEAATGKPFIPVKEEPVPTSAKGITPDVAAQKQLKASETQPIPENTENAEIVPHCANEKGLPNPAPDGTKYVYSCTFAAPGSKHFTAYGLSYQGGQDGKTPLSYDPETGQMYYCETVSYVGRKIGSTEVGGSYFGVNTGWEGAVAALDVDNNTISWRDKLMSPRGACKGGDTTTAGGLVFASANHGEFLAYDAKTGKELWHFQGPENVWAAPVVYEAGGNEYVAIYYGGQVGPNGGMTEPHTPRLLVFSVEAEAQPSAAELPKTEFTPTETEALKLAAEGKEAPVEKEEEEAEEGKGGEVEAHEKAKANAKSGEGAEMTGGETAGAEVFTTNCASCHTLAAAGAKGTVGPNLDSLKPSESAVEQQVINGGGAMPAFGKTKILTPAEIKEVSEYVASEAGK